MASASRSSNDDASKATTPGTAGAVVEFLTYTVDKGYLKAATANAMKVAVREVLRAAEGDDWEAIDVSTVDLTDVLRRFSTLRAMKYKPQSLDTYGKRFASAVEMYRDFAADPSSWRPTMRSRIARGSARQTPASTSEPASTRSERPTEPDAPPRSLLIPYPFPLRDGVLVTVHLPADLTKREASRLVGFIQSLAVDESQDDGASAG